MLEMLNTIGWIENISENVRVFRVFRVFRGAQKFAPHIDRYVWFEHYLFFL